MSSSNKKYYLHGSKDTENLAQMCKMCQITKYKIDVWMKKEETKQK